MRNWLLAFLTVLGALAALMAVAVCLCPRPPRIDRERYDLLAVGMTRQETEARLGRPRNECGDQAIAWVRRGGKRISAVLPADLAAMTFFPEAGEGSEAAWASDGGLIAARFGPDGRLCESYYSEVHVSERPSWLRGVTRLFRP